MIIYYIYPVREKQLNLTIMYPGYTEPPNMADMIDLN